MEWRRTSSPVKTLLLLLQSPVDPDSKVNIELSRHHPRNRGIVPALKHHAWLLKLHLTFVIAYRPYSQISPFSAVEITSVK